MKVAIRSAKADDCKEIHALIKELAGEGGGGTAGQSTLDVKSKITLTEDGFGEIPFYRCLVAELSSDHKADELPAIVGYCLYYFMYLTRHGRAVHMEELYVKKEYKNEGIGLQLWRRLAQESVAKKCKYMEIDALDWNQSSEFYEKFGAMKRTQEKGWDFFHLDEESLQRLAAKR